MNKYRVEFSELIKVKGRKSWRRVPGIISEVLKEKSKKAAKENVKKIWNCDYPFEEKISIKKVVKLGEV